MLVYIFFLPDVSPVLVHANQNWDKRGRMQRASLWLLDDELRCHQPIVLALNASAVDIAATVALEELAE